MVTKNIRIEKDSMGEMEVPQHCLYGATTMRAVLNFPISGKLMPEPFIRALAIIKSVAAKTNHQLGQLDSEKSQAIQEACEKIIHKQLENYYENFPIDVYQTGSATSSNMNVNEVIATLCKLQNIPVHPNDDVNMSQSSNDCVPSAISISATIEVYQCLLPALTDLEETIRNKASDLAEVVTTGRTHLMDAMPVTYKQILEGWAAQVSSARDRITDSLKRLVQIPQGGTAVGTGINAHPQFSLLFCQNLSEKTNITFSSMQSKFEGMSAIDHPVELSGQLNTLAVTLMKISNDLRWMNSGPLAGLGEINLPALQPGSSIMPGKVNPVIPEATTMVCAQVMGYHHSITIAGQSGNFQLNVMLPMVAYSLLTSIAILGNSARLLAHQCIKGFTVNHEKINASLSANPILVTALNSVVGYETGAKIAKTAYKEKRPVIDVALELTKLSRIELEKLLDPMKLTKGGNP
ncbi:MAG: class II fumarate hydratase [Methylacidiphilales bacterium]|nr:class II fumarate hydratase [Candidatus Methylacidiphilales bacterium]